MKLEQNGTLVIEHFQHYELQNCGMLYQSLCVPPIQYFSFKTTLKTYYFKLAFNV
ncbi:hypothetical protein HOLleu_03674 [Holothuria leucospilota]|uniref:Uncharacterized protein n=1 Tax=Holothuria leucospilota TaxID=206669 RepID=A0A9Q1HLY2_HOLLE|nr:hypothetical protein HOLleu_03674 [Holothuria leucospilota]